MNRGTPADPLRERLSAYLADAVEYKREWVPISLQTLREIIAALATKPAEMADEFERGRQQGMRQERALWNLTASSQEIEGHPTESAGKPAEPALTDEQAEEAAYQFFADNTAWKCVDPMRFAHKSAWRAALTHRSATSDLWYELEGVIDDMRLGKTIPEVSIATLRRVQSALDSHPAQAVASSPEAADEECEPFKEPPAFTAWWSLANRPYHWTQTRLVALHAWNAALADTQRSSPTAGSDEAKDRGAPLGSEPATVWKIDWPEEQDEEPSYTENPNIAELARKMGRTVTAFAALASPPAGEKE